MTTQSLLCVSQVKATINLYRKKKMARLNPRLTIRVQHLIPSTQNKRSLPWIREVNQLSIWHQRWWAVENQLKARIQIQISFQNRQNLLWTFHSILPYPWMAMQDSQLGVTLRQRTRQSLNRTGQYAHYLSSHTLLKEEILQEILKLKAMEPHPSQPNHLRVQEVTTSHKNA